MMNIQLINNPNDFKVARVISICDPTINKYAKICYMRPLTPNYNKDTIDEFDMSIISWLNSLNLQNVDFSIHENIIFDYQMSQLEKIFNGGRPSSQLIITAHGDYSIEEIMAKGSIEARQLTLNVYWNTLASDVPFLGGVVTFEKTREKYYFDTFATVTSL